MEGIANYYQKGLELAEAGRHKEALECLQLYLGNTPNDAQAINDAGAILHCLGAVDEAIEYFRKARMLLPDSAEVVWNLVEAYLAVGNAKHAVGLFDDMARKGILNADVLNRTANILLDQGDKANALETLLRSLQMSPESGSAQADGGCHSQQKAEGRLFLRLSRRRKVPYGHLHIYRAAIPGQIFRGQGCQPDARD